MEATGTLPQPTRNADTRERKKTRRRRRRKTTSAPKKRGHSVSHHEEDTDNPRSMLPPSTLPVSLPPLPCTAQPVALLIKGGEKEGGAAPRWSMKTPPLASPTTTTTTTTTHAIAGGPACSRDVAELDAQARESLRWEGVLEDPLAEEERLELYRAKRRQRYLALTHGLMEETPVPS